MSQTLKVLASTCRPVKRIWDSLERTTLVTNLKPTARTITTHAIAYETHNFRTSLPNAHNKQRLIQPQREFVSSRSLFCSFFFPSLPSHSQFEALVNLLTWTLHAASEPLHFEALALALPPVLADGRGTGKMPMSAPRHHRLQNRLLVV